MKATLLCDCWRPFDLVATSYVDENCFAIFLFKAILLFEATLLFIAILLFKAIRLFKAILL